MPVDCVLCLRDESGKYFINAYVTILSILKNTNEKIRIHILHDSTIEHGRKYLEELCYNNGHDILFHKVPDDSFDAQTAGKLTTRFNIGTTYRYYIHDLVDAEKVLYLDCDVIVNRDIMDIYGLPLGDRLFASTLDYGPYWKNGKPRRKYKKTIDYLNLKQESYISAGLVLMNLGKLRELSGDSNIFVQKTLAAVNDGINLPYLDMDIMNSVAATAPDSVLILDDSFNLWHKSMHLGIEDLQGKIFHYVSKPSSSLLPAHLLFWKYYSMTPFAGDMFDRMSAAYCSMEMTKYYCMHPKHRRHARDLLRYGMVGMLLRALGRMLRIWPS